ncbi:MAG: hypothetical protein H7267_11850 [Sandarakinorhabdus sp.]|nr:hypothetical protein [Sandarakinorhabdus sp.]
MRQDEFVDKKQARPIPKVSERLNITRMLWVLGLVAGIAIGAAVGIGIAGSQPATVGAAAQ